eukprot:symbB.v1.2.039989.t1/scaffold6920.1/size14603/1
MSILEGLFQHRCITRSTKALEAWSPLSPSGRDRRM